MTYLKIMKKLTWYISFLFPLLALAYSVHADWFEISDDNVFKPQTNPCSMRASPRLSVNENTDGLNEKILKKFSITLNLSGFYSESVYKNDKEFDVISLPGWVLEPRDTPHFLHKV